MTWEEAIDLVVRGEWIYSLQVGNKEMQNLTEAISIIDTALRHVSREQELEAENMELKERIINWRKYMAPTREQVEKVWRGEPVWMT